MNYYNPYFLNIPNTISTPTRVGLFSRLFGGNGITFGGILNGTQRALSFANQAIPFVKQVRPMIGNAKTMFKVMSEFKRIEKPKNSSNNIRKNNNYYNYQNSNKNHQKNNETVNNQSNYMNNDEGPTFFM